MCGFKRRGTYKINKQEIDRRKAYCEYHLYEEDTQSFKNMRCPRKELEFNGI